MQQRRRFLTGVLGLTALGALPARRAMAQYYAPQGYPPPPPGGYPPPGYPDPREQEHRRYEEERRREEYEHRGGPPHGGGVYAIQQERNRRVLGLQQQLNRGQISRRQFNDEVAEIDREMNGQIYGR